MPVFKRFIPQWANPLCGKMYRGIRRICISLETLEAKKAFSSALDVPLWPGPDILGLLQKKYPPRPVGTMTCRLVNKGVNNVQRGFLD